LDENSSLPRKSLMPSVHPVPKRELKKSRMSIARLVCHWLKRHPEGATKVNPFEVVG
jgi:hypothetical protein